MSHIDAETMKEFPARFIIPREWMLGDQYSEIASNKNIADSYKTVVSRYETQPTHKGRFIKVGEIGADGRVMKILKRG